MPVNLVKAPKSDRIRRQASPNPTAGDDTGETPPRKQNPTPKPTGKCAQPKTLKRALSTGRRNCEFLSVAAHNFRL